MQRLSFYEVKSKRANSDKRTVQCDRSYYLQSSFAFQIVILRHIEKSIGLHVAAMYRTIYVKV